MPVTLSGVSFSPRKAAENAVTIIGDVYISTTAVENEVRLIAQ